MATDLKEFFSIIHESLKQVMHAENFYIALYDPKRNIISFPYFVDQNDPVPLPKLPGRGMTEYVLRTGKPSLVTPEVFSELEIAGEVENSGSPSLDWVGVPLKAGDQTLGVMVVQVYDEDIRYEKRDVDVLDFITDQVEMVIHRKLAEESLRESEHKFSLFMDHLPLQSTISNESGRMVYANNETLRMLGDLDAAGKTYAEIFPPELAKTLQDYDHRAMQDGLVHQIVNMETIQGLRSLEMIKFRISNPDDSPLVGGIVLDITERKQAEEKIRMAAEELASAYDETLEGWSRALELREKETAGHSKRVVALTLHLARAVGVPEDQLTHIRRGSFLHDIGKMGIPDSILLKPGPLTAEEWIIMRQHPSYAYKLLKPIKFLSQALEIPYCHHERWNGNGYPRGLKGEQIPLSGRIFAVVDIWDALNSERSYRPAWPESAVRDYLKKESGSLLEASIVEKFFEILDDPSVSKI